MAGYEGLKNYETWRLYVTLRDTMEYRLMIKDWLVQWAEQGYSRSDAADSLHGKITEWVHSDYEDACDNSSWLVQVLMLTDPDQMDIDYDAIVDRFMEDYGGISKKNRSKVSNGRKPRTASAKKPVKKRYRDE